MQRFGSIPCRNRDNNYCCANANIWIYSYIKTATTILIGVLTQTFGYILIQRGRTIINFMLMLGFGYNPSRDRKNQYNCFC